MNRRAFLGTLGLLGVPSRVAAQESGRVFRLGTLYAGQRDAPHHIAFFEELERAGYGLGRNLALDPRGFGLRPEQVPAIARALLDAKVDVFLCGGDPAIRAAQQVTATLPILAITDDIVGSGLDAAPRGSAGRAATSAPNLDTRRPRQR